MLFSVEQAFEGREEIRAPLKTPAWEARLVEAVKHDSIDTVAELRSATFMEACKQAGWKARGSKIKCKSQIKWFDQECETKKENLQSLREKISHNFNNSPLRQLLRDKTKGFKQTCRRKKSESFPGRGTHITRDMCFPRKGNTYH